MSFIEERPKETIYAKLIRAKSNFLPVHKNRKGHNYKYADLETIFDAIKKALFDEDLILIQQGEVIGEMDYIRTVIVSSSGEEIDFGVTPIKLVKPDSQAFGSGLTYARRYAIGMALGLTPEDDDDGAMASGVDPKLEDKRRAVTELGKACIANGYTVEEVTGALNGVKSNELTMAQAIEGEKRLKTMLENAKKGQTQWIQ
jgi:hypothetical protein